MTWLAPYFERTLRAIADVFLRLTATLMWLIVLAVYLAVLAAYYVGLPVAAYWIVLTWPTDASP